MGIKTIIHTSSNRVTGVDIEGEFDSVPSVTVYNLNGETPNVVLDFFSEVEYRKEDDAPTQPQGAEPADQQDEEAGDSSQAPPS